jgi:predicted O-linked N-acetylglucosamine transferase (SPINDLY family)
VATLVPDRQGEAMMAEAGAAVQAFQRGDELCNQGNLAAAMAQYRQAVEADAKFAPAHVALGAVALALGRLAEAQQSFERGLALEPGRAETHYGLGNVLLERGRLDEAVGAYQRALELRPQFPEALLHLGVALGRRRDFALAAQALRIAVSLKPDFGVAHGNLGAALRSLGEFDAAERSYRAALACDPAAVDVITNLGLLLFDEGRIAEAIALYDQAIGVKPDYHPAWRNRIAAELYDPASDNAREGALLSRYDQRFALVIGGPRVSHDNDRSPERRLRIGYVSSDFGDHPIVRNLEPVLAHRDRQRFEIVCYADVARPEVVPDHFQRVADIWRWTFGRKDEEVAAQIRADRIDILVLLANRLDKGRPLLAAHKPAPLRVSFHDPGTSGLSAMQYLIADPVLVPRDTNETFSERVVRLPSFYIHAPLAGPDVGELPLKQRSGATFGSFNNPAKINDEVLKLWGEVLRAVPGSRLKLKFKNWFANASLRQRILQGLKTPPEQVVFVDEEAARADHLRLYSDVDVALDPFPFTGSTTTFEALWMGVPVVTLAGERMAGRWSASMLTALNLPELIASSRDEYVRIAAGLVSAPERLAALRSGLRQRVAASPLCAGDAKARQVERIYRSLWRRWCRDAETLR